MESQTVYLGQEVCDAPGAACLGPSTRLAAPAQDWSHSSGGTRCRPLPLSACEACASRVSTPGAIAVDLTRQALQGRGSVAISGLKFGACAIGRIHLVLLKSNK